MNLKFNDWENEYSPIKNHFNKQDTSHNKLSKYLFNTRGEEYMKTLTFPKNNLWLVYTCREGLYITPLTNRDEYNILVGYIITMNPWNNHEIFVSTQ